MKNANHQNIQSHQRNYRTGILFAIAGTSLFSLKPIFIKLAFQEGIDATTLLALRMIITFPFFLAIFIFALKTRPSKAAHLNVKNSLVVMGLGFLGYYLAAALDFKGLTYISAQMERLILFTYPLMVAVLASVFFHEKITSRIVLALAFSYLGVGLIYFNEPQLSGAHTALGTILVALAGFSFALYLLFSKRLIGLLGSLIFTSLAMMSSTVFVLIQFFFTHEISDLNVSTKLWFISVLLSILSTLIPSFFISEAIHRIGATRASILGSIGPIVTIIFAVYVLNEPFGMLQMAGLALVLLGVNFIRSR